MTLLPCQRVIGKACFKAFPEFARRAIAYRLLHLLIPPDIAKLLPKSLSDPLIAPGVKIPLDARFPPGTCIVPGCSFPAGWDPDQDPPDCAKSAPLPALAMQISGGNPPTYLSPGPSGPLPVQPPAAPAKEEVTVEITAQNDGRQGFTDISWTTCRDALSGNNMFLSETETDAGIRSRHAFTMYQIIRAFFDFDLSAIPATATIVSCTLTLQNYGTETCNATIQEGEQSDSLGEDDYDAFTGSFFDMIAWVLSGNTFNLNAAGLIYIESIFGNTAKLCMREYNHDYVGAAPGDSENFQAGLYWSGAAETNRPVLTVTYTD